MCRKILINLTEQLLKDIGYLAYKIGDLKAANDVLCTCGTETFTGDRIKLKPLKDGEISSRSHIEIASYVGMYYSNLE